MSTVYWNGCASGDGGMPSWPAATCWFWPLSALMTSCVVSERACSLLGSSQTRIEYWPAPKTLTLPTPGRRASWSLRLMVA